MRKFLWKRDKNPPNYDRSWIATTSKRQMCRNPGKPTNYHGWCLLTIDAKKAELSSVFFVIFVRRMPDSRCGISSFHSEATPFLLRVWPDLVSPLSKANFFPVPVKSWSVRAQIFVNYSATSYRASETVSAPEGRSGIFFYSCLTGWHIMAWLQPCTP